METDNFLLGAPLGNLEGFRLQGLYARQKKEVSGNGASPFNLIWASFFDPEYVRILSIWNFCEGPGLP